MWVDTILRELVDLREDGSLWIDQRFFDYCGGLRAVAGGLPAITHVDWSARVQTVDAARSPGVHAILREFERRTGCPVLVNTSVNVRGEPIVGTPEDAFRCPLATEIDTVVIGNHVLHRREQPAWDGAGARALQRLTSPISWQACRSAPSNPGLLPRDPHQKPAFRPLIADSFMMLYTGSRPAHDEVVRRFDTGLGDVSPVLI